jgi:hypothetical protein
VRVKAFVAAAVAAMLLGGCARAARTTFTPEAADAAAVVAGAVKMLGTEPAQFSLTWSKASEVGTSRFKELGDVAADGDWHLAYDGMLLRHVGRDFYYTASPGYELRGAPLGWRAGEWLHTDKIHDVTQPLTFAAGFPWVLARGVARGTQVTRTGNHDFTVGGLPSVPSGPGQQDGETRVAVTVDGSGRFTDMTFEEESVPPDADPWVLTLAFGNYGTSVTVAAPPGHVQEDTLDTWLVLGLL